MAKHATSEMNREQQPCVGWHKPTVAERAIRAGLSAALIAPTIFVSAGYANADETPDALHQESTTFGAGSNGASTSAAEALDRLAAAESEVAEWQGRYAEASAEEQLSATEAGKAEEGLAKAESALESAGMALHDAEAIAAGAAADSAADATGSLESARNLNESAGAELAEAEGLLASANAAYDAASTASAQASAKASSAEAAHTASSSDLAIRETALTEAESRLSALESMTDSERHDAARAAMENARTTLAAARERASQAKEESGIAEASFAAALATYDNATLALEAAMAEASGKRATADWLQADCDDKAESLSSALAAKDSAERDVANREAELSEATAAKEATEAKLASAGAAKADADDALSAAESAANAAKVAADRASETLASGLYGFLEYIGCSEGLSALDGSRYASLTVAGDAKDATSLRSLQAAASSIRECNALRAANGLSPLKVSPLLLAMAAADANYSDTEVAHALQFRMNGENVAWNRGSDPFTQWYDEEKAEYESTGDASEAGHYFNIINPSFTTTGFATCYRGTMRGWTTFAQTFGSAASFESGAMTVDEFEEAVAAFVKAQEDAPAAYAAAQLAVGQAKSRAESAASTLSATEADAEAAAANAKSAASKLNEAVKSLNIAAMRADSAQRDYEDALQKLGAAKTELDEINQAVANAEAYSADCSLALGSAQSALEAAATAAAEAAAAVEAAEGGVSLAENSLAHVDDALADARAEVETARAELSEARALEAERRAVWEGSLADLENVDRALAQAQERLTEAQVAYGKAAEAKAAAASAVTRAQERVDALDAIFAAVESARIDFANASAMTKQAAATRDLAAAVLVAKRSASESAWEGLAKARANLIIAQLDLGSFTANALTKPAAGNPEAPTQRQAAAMASTPAEVASLTGMLEGGVQEPAPAAERTYATGEAMSLAVSGSDAEPLLTESVPANESALAAPKQEGLPDIAPIGATAAIVAAAGASAIALAMRRRGAA